MKSYLLFLSIFLFLFFPVQIGLTQVHQINGTVIDNKTGKPLAGANVFFENTGTGTSTDTEGNFTLSIPDSRENLIISYLGYKLIATPYNDYVKMESFQVGLEEETIAFGEGVVITGSQSLGRTNIHSSVPVDQFSSSLLDQTGRQELSQQLNVLAPSFYSARLTYSDATDHMDPAALRGLSPDQTLILVNGKRHHPSAVVNTLGVVGRGSVINDLNTIPAASISRVEVLRDGASAQYGSDAIAGVINLILKENTGKLDLKTQLGRYYEGDGLEMKYSLNYGTNLAKKGFINFTTEFRKRNPTNRAGIYQGLVYRTADQDNLSLEENIVLDNQEIENRGLRREDFRMQLGNSGMSDLNAFLNAGLPVNSSLKFYFSGGTNFRNSKSAGDFRLPNDPSRRNLSLYPDGYLPEIEAQLDDQFVTAGVKTYNKPWESDLSYSYGRNSIGFYVNHSTNASMTVSPENFYSGEINFSQNVINYNLNHDFSSLLNVDLLMFSLGTEFRLEQYIINAGENDSWINENKVSYPGAQGFPGFQPGDEVNAKRNNLAFFTSVSIIPLDKLLLEAALRFENYSDFGNNLSGKLAARYTVLDWLNIRGSASTGFRAPALHQSNFNYTGSYYFSGYLYEILTARNNSPVTSSFGIPALKEETSRNLSFGITAKPAKHSFLTADLYRIDVKDRIVLSGFFYKGFGNQVVDSLLADLPSTGGAQFFTNAVDTRTNGLELVLSHEFPILSGNVGVAMGLNLSETRIIGNIHSSEAIINNGLADQLFDRQSRTLLESAQPSVKYNITVNASLDKFKIVIRNNYFGKVSYSGIYDPQEDQVYSGKWITDLKLDFRLTTYLTLTAGSNNLLDIYPDKNNVKLQNNGRFIYNTAVTQAGFNGGFYYAGLCLNL